ncbi:MAG: hypothetical protein O3A00_00200 [Planctomycetota bacterium]|nr:hypothetical protein [Planctomycetota bacterium]
MADRERQFMETKSAPLASSRFSFAFRIPLLRFAGMLVVSLATSGIANAAPAKPASILVTDHGWDDGESLDVTFGLSAASTDPKSKVVYYLVQRAGEHGGLYKDIAKIVPEKSDLARGVIKFVADKCELGEPYFFRVKAVAAGGVESEFVESTEAVRPSRQLFAGSRFWMGAITLMICGSVVFYIRQARGGRDLKVRKIAGLEAVEEAVGRATEMGRSCLFIPGILDMNDMQTIAGLTVLSRVSQQAAEYGAKMEVPTSKSLVMTAARETVAAAFLAAGRPDEFNEDNIYYVTDEQFGYVAYLSGMMVREKPAACFYMGGFFAESLILAETGNSIGSIQVAGTAQPAQLPFFVAACDYTLIGEEFFAASAYLSGDPDQLGSLKGQDVGKLIVAVLMIVGCLATTLADLTDADGIRAIADYLRNTILQSSS